MRWSKRILDCLVAVMSVFSQLVTLYITPVYYVYLDKVQNWMNGLWSRWRQKRKRRKADSWTEKPMPVQH